MSFSLDELTVVVLAGGFGTRIKHLLPDIPKPMASVAGRPFLEWVVRFLIQQKTKKIVVSTGYKAEVIETHFSARQWNGVEIVCTREVQPLGTAGGFLKAARESGYTPPAWLVLNGDSLVLTQLNALCRESDEKEFDAGVMGINISDASRYGTLELNDKSSLIGFAEKKPGPAIINAGVYLFRHEVLDFFPSKRPLSFEQEVFPVLLKKGVRIRGEVVDAPFLDIGTEASLKEAEGFIEQNKKHFYVGDVKSKGVAAPD
jgi:D-glycero-alpha-D-manno-heptose 1-phosphate guanylyltransferase